MMHNIHEMKYFFLADWWHCGFISDGEVGEGGNWGESNN